MDYKDRKGIRSMQCALLLLGGDQTGLYVLPVDDLPDVLHVVGAHVLVLRQHQIIKNIYVLENKYVNKFLW